jgi:hypothetical protein
MAPDPIAVALQVAGILDRLGIPHLVGGSVASSIFGEPRATEDVDIVAALPASRVDELIGALEGEFYVPVESARKAAQTGGSFSLIHSVSIIKVDIFLTRDDPLTTAQLDRRRQIVLTEEAGQTLTVASPEDLVLQKLRWYERGGGTSDRQWRDVLGILKVQGERLDFDYLRRQAAAVGLDAPFARALREAGLEPTG